MLATHGYRRLTVTVVALFCALVVIAMLAGTASSTSLADKERSGCSDIMSAARTGGDDPLSQYGLPQAGVPVDITRAMVPSSLTCLGGNDGKTEFVRGVFIEYQRDGEFMGAYVVSSSSVHTNWQQYFQELMPDRRIDVRDLADGGLLVVGDGMDEAPLGATGSRTMFWREAVRAVRR